MLMHHMYAKKTHREIGKCQFTIGTMELSYCCSYQSVIYRDGIFRRLQWVILNSKYRSFLVQILIQIGSTDDKVYEKKLYKEERKNGKDKVL